MGNFKRKKIRGKKARWHRVLRDLNQKADESPQAIEIFTKYGFCRVSWKYKRQLINEFNRILLEKESLNDSRYYVLWCDIKEITDTSILIFDDLDDLHLLFNNKNIKRYHNSDYDVFLELDNSIKTPEVNYIMEDIDPNYLIFAQGTSRWEIDDPDIYYFSLVVGAKPEILQIIKEELN